jgi:Domain of unknown function (DUF4407)
MNNEYPSQKVSFFTKFLWWCAGADSYFLLRSPIQDRVKYAGIGGIVFSTGILATFAGGFAFSTAFGPKGLAGDDVSNIGWTIGSAIFGICWGALIFNLDRFIVSSTGKGDGTDVITLKEFGQALPRLIIALILGITISKPLELKIIETEINVELRKKQQEKMEEFNKNTDFKYKQEISLIDVDITKLETDRNVLVQRQKEAEQEYIDQMQGRSGNAGYGPRAKQLELLKNDKQKEVADYDARHALETAALKARRGDKMAAWENDRNNVNKKQAENLDGLLERIGIADDIGRGLGIALTCIFLSIEMGPIFFKMMMNKGPYDYMVENYNYRMYVRNGIVKEEMIFEGRDGMKLMEKINYLEVENDRKEKVEKLRAQEELSKKIIGVWSSAKMKDIDADASKYYREEQGPTNNA